MKGRNEQPRFCTDTGARLGCNPLRRTPWVTVRLACQQVYHVVVSMYVTEDKEYKYI